MKKEILLLAGLTIIIVMVYVALLFSKTPTPPRAYEPPALKADSLDADRHFIDLRVDSLLAFTGKLKAQNDASFSYSDEGSAILVTCENHRERAFDRIFLNDASLHTFAGLKNANLRIDVSKYSFAIPAFTHNGTRYAKLPVEIAQSMFMSLEP
ncbi:hypothetical protein LZD49_09970 [Dyadobacter sp. CY261]|uniref:hypothetical protein n=1 Tax=Dyadobacter sp. CY261 TaxID=2907203 RepID=UPI001F3EE215|nr:hypothetical protein [Dyadobacter sp. CY261]MCF0070798.1 hypothetical protein [Dyadobacter sp. CY261]